MIVSALATVAAFLVTLSAAIGAISLLARSNTVGKPLRWLWRQNVGDPVGRWFEARVESVVGTHVEYLMHHRNNGSSLLDLKESMDEAKASIALLLTHDAERDSPGHRYGPEHLLDTVAEVEDGVELLLEHDVERDTPGHRYGSDR